MPDLPATICLLGSSFPDLKSLRLSYNRLIHPLPRDLLPAHPSLEEISLSWRSPPMPQRFLKCGWWGIWQDICNNPKLRLVQLPKLPWLESIASPPYGPRICQAQEKYNLKDDDASVDDWVNALVSVQDRIDCFHYLVTQMIPAFIVPTS